MLASAAGVREQHERGARERRSNVLIASDHLEFGQVVALAVLGTLEERRQL